MENYELMRLMLGLQHDDKRSSCLVMALKAARFNLGVDINSGVIEPDTNEMYLNMFKRSGDEEDLLFHERFFTGLTLYLIVLDCIGILFTKKNNNKPIVRALMEFGKMGEKESICIKDLRNTFAHNFGLATEDCKKRKRHYKFSLCFDKNASIIKFNETWNGIYTDKESNTLTEIGILALSQKVENIFHAIKKKCEERMLRFAIEDTNEIMAQFTVLNNE